MRVVACALAVLLGWSASPAFGAPGDRDRSFGRDGLVHSNVGGTDFAKAVLVDSRHRIVVAGWADVKPPADGRYGFGELDFGLVRYTGNGKLDRAFGGDGRVTANLGAQERLSALARQPDGKLVAVGQSTSGNSPDFKIVVARFTEDGRRDADFGGGVGWTKLTLDDGSDWLMPGLIQILSDGRLLIFGRTDDGRVFAARLLPDGSPDTDFGVDGVISKQFSDYGSLPSAFLLDSRGGLIVAGVGPAAYLDAPRSAVVQRFSLDLSEDNRFGSGGEAVLGVHERGPEALALQGNGIVVAISSGPYGFDGQLVRLTPTGVIDGSFGNGGVASAISPSSLAVDSAGRLLVGGEFPGVVRYSASGALDMRFKNAKPRYSYSHDYGTTAIVSSGRSILGVGPQLARPILDFEAGDYDFGVVRLHGGADGTSPIIALSGPRRACVATGFRLRLRVRDDAGAVRVSVRIDGHRVLATKRSRSLIRVHTRRLRPGKHTVRVVARDGSDNVTVRTLHFKRCR